MDFELLNKHVANGVVNTQRHPHLPLSIYNYSARCQYERLWDEVTIQCRGLVCCGDQIVARPFCKFFNDTEHTDLPWHLPSVVTEKMDGSLGILFCFNGEWVWATRGSFVSEQAVEAAQIWGDSFYHVALDTDLTYLFEIIYPENRIVVDYGSRRDLVLLGAIHTATGIEVSFDSLPDGMTIVRHLGPDAPIRELRSIIRDNEEGYVVRFDNGLRVKVKGARYVEMHKAISGVSSRSVWELLSRGGDVSELLAVVPDECAEWIREEAAMQRLAFTERMAKTIRAVESVDMLPTRREQAQVILSQYGDVSSAAFALLDRKDPSPIVWKSIYPDRRVPRMTARLEG